MGKLFNSQSLIFLTQRSNFKIPIHKKTLCPDVELHGGFLQSMNSTQSGASGVY